MDHAAALYGANMKCSAAALGRFALRVIAIGWLGLGAAQAAEVVWDGGGVDDDWFNATNWVGNVLPVADDFTKQNGTVLYSSGSSPNLRAVRVGNAGTGSMEINGGTLTATFNSGSDSYVGAGAGGNGSVIQNGGNVTFNELEIGRDTATGTYVLNSGSLVVSRALANFSLYLGTDDTKTTGGNGTMTIYGGSLLTRRGVYLGSAGGVGTFSVQGSAATIGIGSSGTLDGEWYQNAGSILKVRINATATGVSKIFIDEVGDDGGGDVTFMPGALLDVGFTGAFTNGGTFTVMEWEGAVTGTNNLGFAPGVSTNLWRFNVDAVNKKLTVTATGAPYIATNVTVSSIAGLRTYAAENNLTVTMTPGTYWMSGEASPLFLDFSGSNNTFNLTGVHIKVDTAELAGYGSSTDVNVLHISGNGVVVDGLTLTMEKLAYNGVDAWGNPKEYTADDRSQLVRVIGSDVTVKNCAFTTGGSYPYGYGDAFGKGARPTDGSGNTDAAWIAHKKQSAFLITLGAGNVTVDNVVLNMRSFGHGFFMQGGAHDIVFKNCQVLGDTMTDSDNIIAHPEYQAWGAATYNQPIPADINISKHEDAFRTYGNDDYATNGYNQWIVNVTLTNCYVERMRNAVAMGANDGYLRVYDTEVKECEMGFGASTYGTSTFLRCKGDAVNGPLIYFQYSVAQPAIYEVELTGDTPGKGVWPIALISGANNRITLTSSATPGVYSPEAYVNTSQKWREWRHRASADIDELGTGNYSDYTTGNFITNLTDQILVFGPNATGNAGCVSTGGVINKGSGNSYTGTTLVPAPIIVQDTWSYPPNSTNVIWAITNSSGQLLSPTPPYTVFAGTQVISNSLSLGGIEADGGTVVGNGGTLEVVAGFASQGEAVIFAGDGVSGQGALFSDGAIANSTRLSSSSGSLTLAGDASIGVGTAGNQFLVGPIAGPGNLAKVGPGRLVMEGGANTFNGALTVVAGEVIARANKVVSNLFILSGAAFLQNASLALNQSSAAATEISGTLDINGRSVGDLNSLSANIGSLTGGASGRITSTATGPVQTLNINSSTSNSSFAGTIDGRVGLVKNGAGTTLTLNGTNAYTGPTTVNAGTLIVNSSLPALSAVSVNNGGTLGGSGMVQGIVTLGSGATVAPGVSVGSLTTGPQTWNGGAALAVEFNSTNGPAGTTWDRLVVNGTVTLDASVTAGTPFQIKLSGPPMPFDNRQSNARLIVDATGIVGGFAPNKFLVDASAFAANNPLVGGQFSVVESGGDLFLNFTPAPYTLLETWRLAYFGSVTNAGAGADDADPDGDRRKNVVEYATGTDPNVFNAGSPATAGKTPDGLRLTVTFNRIADPVLVYAVEAANNLNSSWTNIWSSTGSSNTVGTVTVSDTELISDHGLRFLDVNVSY